MEFMNIFSAPQKVTLNVTNRCNLNCLYCGVSSTKNAPGDLNLEEWKEVVDELARIKVFRLLISGGEPFIYPDLPDLLTYILQYPFRISINTNGTLLDAKMLSMLSGSRRLENVQVSLDGPNSEVHDFIRGKGSFAKSMEGIDLLRRYHIPFSFFVVVSKNNQDVLHEIVEFSNQVGVSEITFSSLLPQGSALFHWKDLCLSFQEQKRVEGELRRLRSRYPKRVGGSLVNAIAMMDRISQLDVTERQPSDSNKITSCGGSVEECSIRPDGWVIPCDRLWDYKVGNVRTESFRDIWQHSQGMRQFRTRYSRSMDSFKECHDCLYAYLCRGGCPAVPYNMGRGIDGWDPLSCYKVFIGQKNSYV